MVDNPPAPEDVLPERIWVWKPEILHGELTASSSPKNHPATEYIRADLASTPAIADGVGVEERARECARCIQGIAKDAPTLFANADALTAWFKTVLLHESTPPQAATDEGV